MTAAEPIAVGVEWDLTKAALDYAEWLQGNR